MQAIVADAIGEPGSAPFSARASWPRRGEPCDGKTGCQWACNCVDPIAGGTGRKFPDLPPASKRNLNPRARHPIDPAFRVSQLSVGYDEDEDMVWVIAKAMVLDDKGQVVDPDSGNVPSARFVATRSQVRELCEHALQVVSAGRPNCPLCGRPIDRNGHFCPRSDGHAVPIIF